MFVNLFIYFFSDGFFRTVSKFRDGFTETVCNLQTVSLMTGSEQKGTFGSAKPTIGIGRLAWVFGRILQTYAGMSSVWEILAGYGRNPRLAESLVEYKERSGRNTWIFGWFSLPLSFSIVGRCAWCWISLPLSLSLSPARSFFLRSLDFFFFLVLVLILIRSVNLVLL